MKTTALLLSLTLGISVLVSGQPAKAQLSQMRREQLTLQIITLGYDPVVASRLLRLRPDVAYLTTHPEINVHYGVPAAPADSHDFIKVQQSRQPVLIYRGLPIEPENYNPRSDDSYVSTPLLPAFRFAFQDDGSASPVSEHGMIIELQVPSFLAPTFVVSNIPNLDQSSVIFRKVVPDDFPFIRRIGIVKRTTVAQAFSETDLNQIQWFTLKQILPRLKNVHPTVDVVFNSHGGDAKRMAAAPNSDPAQPFAPVKP